MLARRFWWERPLGWERPFLLIRLGKQIARGLLERVLVNQMAAFAGKPPTTTSKTNTTERAVCHCVRFPFNKPLQCFTGQIANPTYATAGIISLAKISSGVILYTSGMLKMAWVKPIAASSWMRLMVLAAVSFAERCTVPSDVFSTLA